MPEEKSVALLAHAKVNLTLSVIGKRADGYHSVDSVMQSVSLANHLTVKKISAGISLSSSDPGLPLDRRNTAMQAAEGFFTAAGFSGGAEINIKKNVPYEAGLGSASADAAGALAALNVLYGFPLTKETLFAVACSVGADVPFCLSGGTQRATGIGEILTPLPALCDCCFVIAKGSRGVSTPAAYRAVDACGLPAGEGAEAMAEAIGRGNCREIAALCQNAFTACCGDEETKALCRLLLQHGALCASMSGSGSAVFGLFETKKAAKAAAGHLQGKNRFVTVAAPVSSGITFL